MKTLVIHPKDITTDFLIYSYINIPEFFCVRDYITQKKMCSLIEEYDKIIMLGHGTELGLICNDDYIINKEMCPSLINKECLYIWCNANMFVNKNNLKGFNTGMIISEKIESYMYLNTCNEKEIEDSNTLFTKCIEQYILKPFYNVNYH